MSSRLSNEINFTQFSNIVNGEKCGSSILSKGLNPSTKEKLWDVPIASVHDLDKAVASAKHGRQLWLNTTVHERQVALKSCANALLSLREEMAHILMQECGKPRSFALLEVEHAAGFLDYYSREEPPAEEVIQDHENLRLTLRYIPVGIVGAICPWNFPLVLSVSKIGSALLTGNPIIVKPSPYSPYTTLKFAELVQNFLPPGVLQALNGDNDFGAAMVTHLDIPKISFTGSTDTGRRIMASASQALKNLTLELGGNDAAIICNDVNIDEVAREVAIGTFFNSGQMCLASKRIYIHRDIFEEFVQKMVSVVESWAGGDGPEENLLLGPIQNEMQYAVVKRFFDDCVSNKYKFALKGGPATGYGLFFYPSIVEAPPDSSLIVTGEQFGKYYPTQFSAIQ
ncbi:hypothetical protein Plec18170_006167 [Paecilomyces lecythidis]